MKLSDVLHVGGEPVQQLVHPLNVTSAGITVGALLGHLPNIAAGFTVLWLGMNMYFMVRDRIKKGKTNGKPR